MASIYRSIGGLVQPFICAFSIFRSSIGFLSAVDFKDTYCSMFENEENFVNHSGFMLFVRFLFLLLFRKNTLILDDMKL